MARRSIWTRAKHRVGLERPPFFALKRGQKDLWGRSSPVFCAWLSLHIDRNNAGDRVRRVKTVKNAFCTIGASTSSPSVQISTAFSRNSHDCMCETPRAQNPQIGRERPRFFGFQPPRNFSGSLPPVVGLWCARFFGKCETASLLADRISVLGEVGFTLHLYPRNSASRRRSHGLRQAA